MLKSNTKGLYLELSDVSLLAARTSGLKPPFALEAIDEIQLNQEVESIRAQLFALMGNPKVPYLPAICAMYPPSRLVRRVTLDNPAKARDPAFLADLITNQFKVNLESHMITVMTANEGSEFQPERVLAKEIVFCGAPHEEILEVQNTLVEYGVYPERLEIGTVATLGVLMDMMERAKTKNPIFVLEITDESSQVFILQGKQLDVARPIPFGFKSMYPIIKKELGLKDEESAQKLFNSNTFDFTEMGPLLLRKILKELQASTGFYEVQTGQTIGHLFVSMLPANLAWIPTTLSRSLGMELYPVTVPSWLESQGIEVDSSIPATELGSRWLGLFSLMGIFGQKKEGGENGR